MLHQMARTAALPLVRTLTVAAFIGVSAACAVLQFRPENPQWVLLAVASLGTGAIVAGLVFGLGEFLSRRSVGTAISAALSRGTYTRQSVPTLLLLGIFVAAFVMFALHLIQSIRHGSTLSGWTAAVFAAIIFYPMIRHRIERGRWPD